MNYSVKLMILDLLDVNITVLSKYISVCFPCCEWLTLDLTYYFMIYMVKISLSFYCWSKAYFQFCFLQWIFKQQNSYICYCLNSQFLVVEIQKSMNNPCIIHYPIRQTTFYFLFQFLKFSTAFCLWSISVLFSHWLLGIDEFHFVKKVTLLFMMCYSVE
jgi:hypothetical protein